MGFWIVFPSIEYFLFFYIEINNSIIQIKNITDVYINKYYKLIYLVLWSSLILFDYNIT